MARLENEGKTLKYPKLIIDVVGASRLGDDAILVVFTAENGAQVSLKIQDSAAHTLVEKVSEALRSA